MSIARGPSTAGLTASSAVRSTSPEPTAGRPVEHATAPGSTSRVVTPARIKAARLAAAMSVLRRRVPNQTEAWYAEEATYYLDINQPARSWVEAEIVGEADMAEQALVKGWTR